MADDIPQVVIDPGDLSDVQVLLAGIQNAYPRAVTNAINKTLAGVITDAAREITKDLNLTQTRVKQDMYSVKATWSNMQGAVYAIGGPVNLASFSGFRVLKEGFSVRTHKSKPITKFKHGFVWVRPTKAGGTAKTAFQRLHYQSPASSWRFSPSTRGFIGKLSARDREVETLTGPRIEDEYAKPQVLKAVQDSADKRFQDNLKSQVDYELQKFARKF